MKKILTGLLLLVSTGPSKAAIFEYDLSYISADRWQYDYTITNDGALSISAFTVYFDDGLYSSIATLTPSNVPADWTELADVQPDNFLGNPGEYTAYTSLSTAEIGSGASLGLFSVQFDWLGQSSDPGSQPFDIFETSGFTTLETGVTQPISAIPVPAALWLFGTGILGLIAAARRNTGDSIPNTNGSI